MPGAKITERLPDGGYKGTVTVRVGPATMSFRGEVEVRDVDPAARSLRLLGKGTDSTGTSGASMDLAARIEAVADGSSNLVGKSEVSMSGKAAAFGGRMMNSVADQILKQFADNFAAQVAALRGAAATPAPRRRRRRRAAAARRRSGADAALGGAIAGTAARRQRAERPRARLGGVQGLAARSLPARRPREPPVATDERDRRAAAPAAGRGLHRRAPARGGAPADARPRPPAAAGGRRRRGQDRGREGARRGARREADPPAVLRRARRARGDVRMELPAAAAGDQAARARRAPGRAEGAGHLLRALPAEAPAARGDQLRRAAGAPDRRGRPRRRGVRGLSARAAVGFPDVDPGAGHRARRLAPARGHHVQRHARALRRAAPPLPLPVHRLSGLREGARDRRDPGAGGGGAARAPAGRVRAERPPHGPAEEAGHRGDARLDRGAAAARHLHDRRRRCGAHPRNAVRAHQDACRPRRLHPRGRRPHRGAHADRRASRRPIIRASPCAPASRVLPDSCAPTATASAAAIRRACSKRRRRSAMSRRRDPALEPQGAAVRPRRRMAALRRAVRCLLPAAEQEGVCGEPCRDDRRSAERGRRRGRCATSRCPSPPRVGRRERRTMACRTARREPRGIARVHRFPRPRSSPIRCATSRR